MTWLAVTECSHHDLVGCDGVSVCVTNDQRMCSVCRNHNTILSSFMTSLSTDFWTRMARRVPLMELKLLTGTDFTCFCGIRVAVLFVLAIALPVFQFMAITPLIDIIELFLHADVMTEVQIRCIFKSWLYIF